MRSERGLDTRSGAHELNINSLSFKIKTDQGRFDAELKYEGALENGSYKLWINNKLVNKDFPKAEADDVQIEIPPTSHSRVYRYEKNDQKTIIFQPFIEGVKHPFIIEENRRS